MAKKQAGYYSVEAIQGRQQAALDEYNRVQNEAKKQAKPETPSVEIPQSQGVVPHPKGGTGGYQVSPAAGSLPYNYKNARTDINGKPVDTSGIFGIKLPEPKGFTPDGKPYFGRGFEGWWKRAAHTLFGDILTAEETNAKWKDFWATSGQYSELFVEKTKKDFTLRTAEEVIQDQVEASAKGGQLFLQGAQELFSAMGSTIESTPGVSLLTPMTRLTNLAVSTVLEGFQSVSEVPERIMSVNRAMREYATEAGSTLPSLEFDDEVSDATNAEERIRAYSETANIATRILVPAIPLAAYDSLRFWTSAGTIKEKLDVMRKGWIEGRMYYTTLYEPSVRAEYLQRAKAGEDMELLAMELENPWVEFFGEFVLDPFNVIGAVGKAKKVGDIAADVAKAAEKSGLLAKADFIQDMKTVASAGNEAESVKAVEQMTERIRIAASEAGRRMDAAQSWKMTALSPSGNRFRQTRNVSNYLNNVVQQFRNAGMGVNEIMDYTLALVKRASGDANEIRESIAVLSHSPVQALAYNEAAFDTGYMIRKLADNGNLIKKLENFNGNYADLIKAFDTSIEDAVKFAFPDVSTMRKAAEKVTELEKAGDVADAQTLELANKFNQLKKTNPGVANWSRVQEFVQLGLSNINGTLSHSYFSLSYGHAFRNAIQNMVTLWVDDGISLTKEFMPELTWKGFATPRLDNEIVKMIGYMPESLKGKTMIKDLVGENTLGKKFFNWFNNLGYSPAKLADDAEVYASKMIFVKKYRETMDGTIKAGAALPEMSRWTNAGFTPEQVKDFTEILRRTGYNPQDAATLFLKKHGNDTVDKWRMLDWVHPDVEEGLKSYGTYWDDIMDFANKEGNVSQREIQDFFDGLMTKARKDANKAADETVRMATDTSDPFWKGIADAREHSGKFKDPVDDNKMMALKLSFERLSAQFDDDLMTAMNKVAQRNPQLAGDIRAFLSPVNRQAMNEAATTQVAERLAWVLNVRDQSRNGVAFDLWDEAILGPRPLNVTRDILIERSWNSYREMRMATWSNYYANYTEEAAKLASQTGMKDLFGKSRLAMNELNAYRDLKYAKDGIYTKAPSLIAAAIGEEGNASNIRTLAITYSNGKITNDKAILNIINKSSDVKYTKLTDIDPVEAERILAAREGQPLVGFIKADGEGFIPVPRDRGIKVPPPADTSLSPGAHFNAETKQGLLDALQSVQKGMLERYGYRSATGGNADALKSFLPDMTERLAFAKEKAQRTADYWRDFALLPYGEGTNMDFAMSLIYPYQFWYSRSYKNWVQRAFMTNPEIISRYANLKEAMAKEQQDLPDWWKSQFNIGKAFGLDKDYYVNLEATLFPLYGLTGVDFNDSKKRVNWWTATLDDMGKFGPSMFAPIQWATAAYLYSQGEFEAASRWGGRAIPQTATLKSVSSFFGTPIETDPMMQMFSGDGLLDFRASDPYEDGLISRALSAMSNEDTYTDEELMYAMYRQEGPIWDEAYRRAIKERAPGQLMSFFFGVGFKPRPESDAQIDRFYGDYSRLKNMFYGNFITQQEYQNSMNQLRETYGNDFDVDILLLSRRAGDNRDAAYAYNIMSRLPPGSSKEYYEAAGIDPRTAEKFYDSGGRIESMPESERARFFAAINDLGAMLRIPSNATRQEWTLAKQTYSDMNDLIKQQFGDDIQDKIDKWYELDGDDKTMFEDDHPEIKAALDAQNAYIMNTPILSAYYGGLDTVRRYYDNHVYDQLDDEFGADASDIYYEWKRMDNEAITKEDKAAAKAFYNANNLKAFVDRRKELFKEADALKLEAARNIPESQGAGVRPEFVPQYGIQEDMLQSVPQQAQTAQLIYDELTPEAQELLQDYYQTGELPSAVSRMVERAAEKHGISKYDALLLLGVEVAR